MAASRPAKPPRRGGLTGWGGLTAHEGRSDHVGCTGSRSFEAETRGVIEVLASVVREGTIDARSSDREFHVLTKMPLRGLEL